MYDNYIFFIFLIISFRYPFDEAATIAISTVKESSNDFKEVFLYCFLLLLLFFFFSFFFFLFFFFFCFGHHVSNIFTYFMWQSCLVLINVQFLVNRHLHDVLFALCRYTLFYSLQIFTMCGWTRQTKCWKISLFYQLAMERIMGTCLSYLYVQLFYFEVVGGLCMELPYIKLKYLWLIKFKWQLLLRRCPFSWKNWSC